MPGASASSFEDDVHDVLVHLRRGEVVTYGWVALQAGHPGRSRGVGSYLARGPDGSNWWRVVGSGGVLRSPDPDEQARRLHAEGVVVERGRVRGEVLRP